jgi:hypothetical protein
MGNPDLSLLLKGVQKIKNIVRGSIVGHSFYRRQVGMLKVCKNMFMKTLRTDSARIHRALCKAKSGKLSDLRGKHVPHNKTLPTTIGIIHEHIKSFPTTVSHYNRKDTNKLYLDTNLNLSLMYKRFVEYIKQKGTLQKVPSQLLYEKIFRRDFQLKFQATKERYLSYM